MLEIYPRSSIGFKYQTMLANTVGIIDSDYFYAENEGHIFIKRIQISHDAYEKGCKYVFGTVIKVN